MNITIFDTAIGTSNIGDEIILNSCQEHIEFLLNKSFVMRFATHLSNFHCYQYMKNKNIKLQFADKCDYKFILGTNLLTNNMIKSRGQWFIDLFSKRIYKNSIMYGVGLTFYDRKPVDAYTKYIYNYILRKDIVHSVRDEESKIFIENLGYKALNTGCPTLWNLNQGHCMKIPSQKANNVIISLSGYKEQKDIEKDKKFLKIIKKNYKNIYFWVQTIVDKEYYENLEIDLNVKYIFGLKEFEILLKSQNLDYVGTRLHGGIFALQNNIRTIIISIDNRARGFKETNNIVCIERDNIEQLEEVINSKFFTCINIKEQEINDWISQFK